jgi:hypothetical protein
LAAETGPARVGPASVGSSQTALLDAEHGRLDAAAVGVPWRRWGRYVAARKWGSRPEDYSVDADPWSSFAHDHARSRPYRWAEDEITAIRDEKRRLCLGSALCVGNYPILKERMFGVTGHEGDHGGQDVKE